MGGLLVGSEGNLIVLGSGGDILFRRDGIAVFAAQEFKLPRPWLPVSDARRSQATRRAHQ